VDEDKGGWTRIKEGGGGSRRLVEDKGGWRMIKEGGGG
jgi:hypothetical protein